MSRTLIISHQNNQTFMIKKPYVILFLILALIAQTFELELLKKFLSTRNTFGNIFCQRLNFFRVILKTGIMDSQYCK